MSKRAYNSPSTCGKCGKAYSLSSSLKEHYKTKTVRLDGKYVPNPCYNHDYVSVKNSSEAETIKKLHSNIDQFFAKKNKEDAVPETSKLDDLPETSTASDDLLHEFDEPALETDIVDPKIHSSPISKQLEKIESKIDTVIKTENESQEMLRTVLSSKTLQVQDHSKNSEINRKYSEQAEERDCYYANIRTAHSMASIKKNPLIRDIFIEKHDQESSQLTFLCTKCEASPWLARKDATKGRLGIDIDDPNYDQSVSYGNQPNWFVNFKTALLRHIKKETHIKSVESKAETNTVITTKKNEIMSAMRNLSYFAVKSGVSFHNFPSLMATVHRCKVDLGNINHSEKYIVKYLECLNEVLIESTIGWLKMQEDDSVSITLDIGTCAGVTLLAVLFIVKTEVRIANVLMATSKKGAFLADLCVEAMKMGDKVTLDTLKAKIIGLVGDGAFIKGNKPFKERMMELMEKKLTFRWDILHLVNRAHVPARGKTILEKKKDKTEDDDTDSNEFDDELGETEINDTDLIPKTIGYIQEPVYTRPLDGCIIGSTAKKYRTGIKYTDLLASTMGSFQRPKIWSSTRMVLYDLEMLDRFLDNKVYFEVPVDIEITASVYMIVMFGLKVILKMVQKTDISPEYVNAAFMDETKCYGEKLMLACLDIAVQEVSLGYHELEADIPDVLSQPVVMKGSDENKFYEELKKFLKKHKDHMLVQNIQRSTRNTTQPEEIVYKAKEEIGNYITKLWVGIQDRLDEADTRDLNCTSFSEAPAEGVFSIWERVTSGKGSMTLGHCNALLRVAKEGPNAATDAALNISKAALDLWPSGERFTTQKWMPGMVSKPVEKILRM